MYIYVQSLKKISTFIFVIIYLENQILKIFNSLNLHAYQKHLGCRQKSYICLKQFLIQPNHSKLKKLLFIGNNQEEDIQFEDHSMYIYSLKQKIYNKEEEQLLAKMNMV